MRGSLFYESEAVTGTGYDVIKDGVADSLNASLISNPRKKTVGITPEITIMHAEKWKSYFSLIAHTNLKNEMNYISANCFVRLNSIEVCALP